MTTLDGRIEVAWNAGVRTPAASRVWTDVSDYLELQNEIRIVRGRPDQDGQTAPSHCDLTLDNRDGRFTPGLASGAYYPNVRLGRPLRVLVNLLFGAGTFDDGITAWTGTNATLAQVATPVRSGTGALRLTRVGVGTMSADTATGAAGFPVTEGDTCVAVGWFRAATTGRSCRTRIRFYTAAGALVSTATSTSVTDSTSAWTEAYLEVDAPATAAFASVGGEVLAPGASEQHYMDDMFFGSPRFTGYVDDWGVDWPDGIDAMSVAEVKASGRTATLGEGAELRSIIETEILLDNPVAYYPLGEPTGSLHAFEATGSDDVGMFSRFGGTDIEFGTGTGPATDGLPAARIDSYVDGTDSTPPQLAAYFDEPLTTVTLEMFVRCPTRNTNDVVNYVALYDSEDNQNYTFLALQGSFTDSFGQEITSAIYTEQSPAAGAEFFWEFIAGGTNVYDGGNHHLALTYDPAAALLDLYIDGELQTTSNIAIGVVDSTLPEFHLLLVGPFQVDAGNTNAYTVSHVAVFDSILSADRIAAHAASGLDGFQGELAGERIPRYLSYAGIEASQIVSDDGIVPLDFITTVGKSVDSLLRVIETTENGLLFDRRDGKLGFLDRQHRYQVTSAFTIDVADQELETGGLRPVLDRSLLINDVTAKSTDGTVEQRFVDDTFADEAGPNRVDIEVATTDVDQVYQSAAWRVNKYKEPTLRVPVLAPVDVLPLDAALRAAIIAADISTRFTVDGMPAQLGTSADFFVEGLTETLGIESWRFQFNVSATKPYDEIWVLGDATRSQLDSTTILAL